MRGDSEQSFIEALKLAADFFIVTLAPVHFQEVARSRQGLADSGKAEIGVVGNGECRRAMRLDGILTGGVELALQVLLGDLHVPQCHADIVVPQQPHQSRKTDTEADHLRSEAVPQPVRRDGTRTARSFGSIR